MNYEADNPEHVSKIPSVRWLLQEILGYTEEEVFKMEENGYRCDIAKGLALAQALQIAQPFKDYDVTPYLWQEDQKS